jgi:hypothetical protein
MARCLSAILLRLLTFIRGQRSGANGYRDTWRYLGKNVCSLVALDGSGRVVLRRRLRQSSEAEFAEKWPGCVVAMEACCGAHHLGRELAARGHEVRLMLLEYVRPYVNAQKNDDRVRRGLPKQRCARGCGLYRLRAKSIGSSIAASGARASGL